MNTLNKLVDIISDIVPYYPKEMINKNTDLINDLMIDSISFIQLIVAIEECFIITIDEEYMNINKLRTIQNMMDTINELTK